MAAGCCVVATPTDGVNEQIEHLHNGLLCDTISGNALATQLRRAVEDLPLRSRLALNGIHETSKRSNLLQA